MVECWLKPPRETAEIRVWPNVDSSTARTPSAWRVYSRSWNLVFPESIRVRIVLSSAFGNMAGPLELQLRDVWTVFKGCASLSYDHWFPVLLNQSLCELVVCSFCIENQSRVGLYVPWNQSKPIRPRGWWGLIGTRSKFNFLDQLGNFILMWNVTIWMKKIIEHPVGLPHDCLQYQPKIRYKNSKYQLTRNCQRGSILLKKQFLIGKVLQGAH